MRTKYHFNFQLVIALGIIAVIGAFLPRLVSAANVSTSSLTQFVGENANNNAGNALATGDFNGDGYEDLLIGAEKDDGPSSNAGAAYVLYGGSSASAFANPTDLSNADAKWTGETSEDNAGKEVASGDLNGDGYDEIIISAYSEGDTESDYGLVYIFYGKATKYSGTASLSTYDAKYTGETHDDQTGTALATGDLNSDGYYDLVMGAPYQITKGAVYILYGKAAQHSGSNSVTTVDTKLTSEGAAQTRTGEGVAAGDINGDGYPDLLIGTSSGAGGAFIVYSSASKITSAALSTSSHAKFTGESAGDQTGMELASGDINGDGYDEMIISSRDEDTGGNGAGAQYIINGKAAKYTGTTSLTNATAKFTGEAATDSLNPNAVGDINKDGYADMLFGSNNGTPGAAYLVFGKSAGFSGVASISSADHKFVGQSAEGAGDSVALGDINGDGFADIIIGAMENTSGGASAGSAYLGYGYIDKDGDGIAGPDGLWDGVDVNDNDKDNDGSETGTDCDDDNANISENQTYYTDSDGDGLGDPNSPAQLCSATAPEGYSENNTDTNDSIRSNGVEISGDGIDNNGDGEVDEVNTGTHPEYGTYDADDSTIADAAIKTVTGAKRGRIKVKYKDNSVFRYNIYTKYKKKKLTKVKQFRKQGRWLVLHPLGKKVALVNVMSGNKQATKKTAKSSFKKAAVKLFKIRKKWFAVITLKKKAIVRLVIVKIKPKKKAFGKKSAAMTTSMKVVPAKTKKKRKRIMLRNKKGKAVRRYLVTKKLNLKAL